jgi:hypothetical protein
MLKLPDPRGREVAACIFYVDAQRYRDDHEREASSGELPNPRDHTSEGTYPNSIYRSTEP